MMRRAYWAMPLVCIVLLLGEGAAIALKQQRVEKMALELGGLSREVANLEAIRKRVARSECGAFGQNDGTARRKEITIEEQLNEQLSQAATRAGLSILRTSALAAGRFAGGVSFRSELDLQGPYYAFVELFHRLHESPNLPSIEAFDLRYDRSGAVIGSLRIAMQRISKGAEDHE